MKRRKVWFLGLSIGCVLLPLVALLIPAPNSKVTLQFLEGSNPSMSPDVHEYLLRRSPQKVLADARKELVGLGWKEEAPDVYGAVSFEIEQGFFDRSGGYVTIPQWSSSRDARVIVYLPARHENLLVATWQWFLRALPSTPIAPPEVVR